MDNPRTGNRESDLVLPPNTHAFVLNKQKGEVDVFVGPHKSNLDGNTDQPVRFDYNQKKFVDCTLMQSIQNNVIAPEGWYLILKNPNRDGSHPKVGQNGKPDLNIGKKVNLKGAEDFALFPGQMCKVVQGHHLRTNQYLIVRVYDEESAKENLKDAVIKSVEGEEVKSTIDEKDITMGKLMIIKGTEVSFYIPPTGIEVLTQNETYTQNAVTLERLEYCILLDEDGNKEYVRGPAVVFPKPTQQFITDKEGNRKYQAITLNNISGLYISVITDYEEDGKKYKAGDEIFITGKDNSIYFPREEHAIIKYGGKQKHHAIALPKGEGRYVMNRETGEIELVRGAKMLLPDPRNEVIVKRVLSIAKVQSWFPNNQEALNYNTNLLNIKNDTSNETNTGYVTDENYVNYTSNISLDSRDMENAIFASTVPMGQPRKKASKGYAGDQINRGTEFTKPRSICLDNSKFDGAVRINVWRGYAINVESTSKDSEVVIGSKSRLLEYDEDLVTMELSRGTPKTTEVKLQTPYLRILNNRISDRVDVVTKDLCEISMYVSYMVNFNEADKDKWFNVENYVQFLCERMRSMIQRMVKQHGVEEFYQNYIELTRDLVLDKTSKTNANPSSQKIKPEGRYFSENGMYITDVEFNSCEILDNEIEHMLNSSQSETIKQELELKRQSRSLTLSTKIENTKRAINEQMSKTRQEQSRLEKIELDKGMEVKMTVVDQENTIAKTKRENDQKLQTILTAIAKSQVERNAIIHKEEQDNQTRLIELDGERLSAESKAFKERFEAFTPQLIEAMQQLGDKNLVMEVSKNLSVNTILGDKNVRNVLTKALSGTSLGNNLESLIGGFKNLQKINGGSKVKSETK